MFLESIYTLRGILSGFALLTCKNNKNDFFEKIIVIVSIAMQKKEKSRIFLEKSYIYIVDAHRSNLQLLKGVVK